VAELIHRFVTAPSARPCVWPRCSNCVNRDDLASRSGRRRARGGRTRSSIVSPISAATSARVCRTSAYRGHQVVVPGAGELICVMTGLGPSRIDRSGCRAGRVGSPRRSDQNRGCAVDGHVFTPRGPRFVRLCGDDDPGGASANGAPSRTETLLVMPVEPSLARLDDAIRCVRNGSSGPTDASVTRRFATIPS
jgi:hypothetical protein